MEADKILNELFDGITEKFNNAIGKLKSKKSELFEIIDIEFNEMRKKVDDRIDQLKKELDLCGDVLKKELKEFQNNYTLNKLANLDTSNYEEEYKTFPLECSKKSESVSKELCDKAQKELDEMQKSFNAPFENEIKFKLHSRDFDSRCVGALWFKTNIIEQIKSKRFNEVKVKYEPKRLCEIPENRLLISCVINDQKRCLSVYDDNYKLVRTITTINNKEINPSFLSTDGKSRIFISELTPKRVIMTDLEFNFIKYYESDISFPSTGFSFYYNENLYVCNYKRSKIRQFDMSFNVKADYLLERRPLSLHILNNVVMINEEYHGSYSVAFFDLTDFNIIKRHDGVLGSVVPHMLFFYLLTTDGKCFKIFNLCGDLIEEIRVEYFEKEERKGGAFCYFNGNLVIASSKSRKLLII